MKLADKMERKISRSKRDVFLREDFADLAGYDQVGRALKELIKREKLMRVGYGVYTKAEINPLTGKPMPASKGGRDGVFIGAMERLGIKWEFTGLTKKYLNGEVTQVPAGKEFKIINKKRFSRKLKIGKSEFSPQI